VRDQSLARSSATLRILVSWFVPLLGTILTIRIAAEESSQGLRSRWWLWPLRPLLSEEAPDSGRSKGTVNAHVQSIWLSLVGALAIFGVAACTSPLSQREIETHFSEVTGPPNYLFAPGGHIDFDANTAELIRRWLAAHRPHWRAASLSDFDPVKTQLLTANSVVEIDGERIVVTFESDAKDLGSTVYIQRPLSPSDQLFWSNVVNQIRSTGTYEGLVHESK